MNCDLMTLLEIALVYLVVISLSLGILHSFILQNFLSEYILSAYWNYLNKNQDFTVSVYCSF